MQLINCLADKTLSCAKNKSLSDKSTFTLNSYMS